MSEQYSLQQQLQSLQQQARRSPQAASALQPLQSLMQRWDEVAQTSNAVERWLYYQSLVQELTKLYYIRMRVIELDESITTVERNHRLDQLQTELQNRLVQLARLLDHAHARS